MYRGASTPTSRSGRPRAAASWPSAVAGALAGAEPGTARRGRPAASDARPPGGATRRGRRLEHLGVLEESEHERPEGGPVHDGHLHDRAPVVAPLDRRVAIDP